MNWGSKKNLKVIAMAMTLPSSLIALSWILLFYVDKKIIHPLVAIGVIVVYIFYTIFLIGKFLSKKGRNKNEI